MAIDLNNPIELKALGIGKKKNVGMRARQAMCAGALSGNGGYSWHQMQELPADYAAVRLSFLNITALPITLDNVIAAAASTTASYAPSGNDENGLTASWQQVTFGGATAGVIPANNNSDRASNPIWLASDWIPVYSVPRSDGGAFPLLHTRAYIASTDPLSLAASGVADANWQTPAADKLYHIGRYKLGDFCSSNQAGFTGPTDPGQYPVVMVEYLPKTIASLVSIVFFGDSNMRGQQASADGNAFGPRAATQLASNGIPVGFGNFGWGGNTIAVYYKRWQTWLAAAKLTGSLPAIAVFQCGTSNGFGGSAADIRTSMFYVHMFIADCLALGIIPLITTMLPKNDYTLSQDNIRKTINTKVKALASQTVFVADIASAVGDGASPERFASGTAFSDGIHMIDAGHALAKVPMLDALTAAIYQAA